jgi:hypothetical protein
MVHMGDKARCTPPSKHGPPRRAAAQLRGPPAPPEGEGSASRAASDSARRRCRRRSGGRAEGCAGAGAAALRRAVSQRLEQPAHVVERRWLPRDGAAAPLRDPVEDAGVAENVAGDGERRGVGAQPPARAGGAAAAARGARQRLSTGGSGCSPPQPGKAILQGSVGTQKVQAGGNVAFGVVHADRPSRSSTKKHHARLPTRNA